MKCFYHGADMDGKASGAIVRKFYGDECEYIPYFYKDFPFDSIEKDESVIIVDCSCDFNKLLKITKDIIWIDHHKTAIDQYEHLKLKGERVDGIAACELTWEYFYNSKLPLCIKLFGDYDVWKFAYGEDSNRLQTGIRLYDNSVESPMWNKWLDKYYLMEEELEKGAIALQYRDSYYKSLINSLSFYTDFEGYIAICCNAGSVSSQLFDSLDESTYDIMIPFSFNGEEWTCSLYTKKEIDCGTIAKKYGGGGHKQAAGFRIKELPFKKI